MCQTAFSKIMSRFFFVARFFRIFCDEITPLFHGFSNSQLVVSLSEMRDEHVIAVREEPVLDLLFYQRNVTDGTCEPIEGVQDSTFTSGKKVSGCLSDCQTKTISYLKEDQSEFCEERRWCQFAQLLL